jgi:hypothetical protein
VRPRLAGGDQPQRGSCEAAAHLGRGMVQELQQLVEEAGHVEHPHRLGVVAQLLPGGHLQRFVQRAVAWGRGGRKAARRRGKRWREHKAAGVQALGTSDEPWEAGSSSNCPKRLGSTRRSPGAELAAAAAAV